MSQLKSILLLFILCVVFSTTHSRHKRANQKSTVTIPERPRLTFIYSSSNKESAKFISEQLLPTYKKLRRHMLLELVPFGNSLITQDKNGNYTLNCTEENQAECDANKVQGCVLGERGGTIGHLTFIECYMRTGAPKKYQMCAYKAKLNHLSIEKCLKSNGSMKNLKQMGKSIQFLNMNNQSQEQNNSDSELPDINDSPEIQVTELPVNKTDKGKEESSKMSELPQDKGKEAIPNPEQVVDKTGTDKEEFPKVRELDQNQIKDNLNKSAKGKENISNKCEFSKEQITDSGNKTGKLPQPPVTELPSNNISKGVAIDVDPGKSEVIHLRRDQTTDLPLNNTDTGEEEFPDISQLPVIIFNDNYSMSLQNEAKKNLFKVICKLRKYPPECKNVAPRKSRQYRS